MYEVVQFGTVVVMLWIVSGALFRGDAVKPAALWLALVTGGLLWESVDPWMPPDLRSLLLRSAVALVGTAAVAIMLSARSGDGWRATVALLGATGITGVVLAYDVGEYRSPMILAATVLMVVAVCVGVHMVLARYVLVREEQEAAMSLHRLWLTGMVWAVLLAVGLVALWLQPMPRWAELLVTTAAAAAAIAGVMIGETIGLMWRHRGFASAYAVAMSQARINVRGAMVAGVVLLSPSVPLPGIVQALGGSPGLVSVVTWMATFALVGGVWVVMRTIRREAVRARRSAMAGTPSAGVRDRASEEPVYRLMPGLPGRRD